jgi:hypothetical protein
MAKKHTYTRLRDEALLKRYKEMDAKRTPKGRSLYSHAAILETLSAEFYIGEAHVGRILKAFATDKPDGAAI